MDVVSTKTCAPPPWHSGPLLSVKRFGRTDFERFDQDTARGSQLCVGSKRIGKVEIDCKYHWKKAQWGTLGQDYRPAGIVYMDINFKQPTGYRLESASVYVTLAADPHSYALGAEPKSSRRLPQSVAADYTVQITEHYGPRLLNGQKTVQHEMGTTNLTPQVGAAGFEVGGLGIQMSKAKHNIDAWSFRGSVGRPRNQDGLRTLHWEFKENSLDQRQIHSQEYSTAFTFEHSRRPVFMRVEIDGTLRGKGQSLRHDILRFSSRLGGKDNSTLTHMDFHHWQTFTKSLDDVARGLDLAMQMENWKKASVELPGSIPAHFIEQGQNPNQNQQLAMEDERRGPATYHALTEAAAAGQEDPTLEALTRHLHGMRVKNAEIPAIQETASAALPVSRNMATTTTTTTRMTSSVSAASRQSRRKRVRNPTSTASSECVTVRARRTAGEEATRTKTTDSEPGSETAVNTSTSSKAANDKVDDVVAIPAILIPLIRFLIILVTLFSREERDSRPPAHVHEEWDGSADEDGYETEQSVGGDESMESVGSL